MGWQKWVLIIWAAYFVIWIPLKLIIKIFRGGK